MIQDGIIVQASNVLEWNFTTVPVIERILVFSIAASEALRFVVPFRMLDSSLRALRTIGP
jgi:hypothetical protein